MARIKTVRLSRVNSNLLVSLQVLLQECNVTRASERLGLTPSAVSKNLAWGPYTDLSAAERGVKDFISRISPVGAARSR